jgi:hypothetical protein
VLLAQLHPQLAGGASLLRGLLLVLRQPALQEWHYRPGDRLRARLRQPVARRLVPFLQILVDRLPRTAQLRRDAPLAPPLPVVEPADQRLAVTSSTPIPSATPANSALATYRKALDVANFSPIAIASVVHD